MPSPRCLKLCTESSFSTLSPNSSLLISEKRKVSAKDSPRLSHANAAVVLSTIKVLMRFMELIPDVDYKTGLLRKLSPPLVTLLSSEPEVQYVALRNINLIVQKRSEILKHEIKVFFVKYNDPIYVKFGET
ncbi:unnamed protein product [Oikopleura dioica]|uniref:Clathrin/coatomer adaptor adaptin-like N-terminal domain-containing protein n=1 Tax=Oikopleura dioica TaxID=34765 RepID=E4XZB3_OIKDI|nr:unnamed protein product [Oikopleura dioica]